MAVGKRAAIVSFENDDVFLKLMEMGLVPGEEIFVEQIAPWETPVYFGSGLSS
jgi:Fe2+ transport system protein FeoA